jgi:glycosyltransferase involved in cell wall biosynthesis
LKDSGLNRTTPAQDDGVPFVEVSLQDVQCVDAPNLGSVTVIIPALNEEEALPLVLRDLPPVGSVIVVDNGSSDRTASVASSAGAHVVSEPRRGYGAACLRGLKEVSDSVNRGDGEPKIIVFLDADYSDHPESIVDLVLPIHNDEADFVLGSRLLGTRESGAMPAQSVFGNRFACWLMRLLFRAKYSDLGPFRAIRYSALKQLDMQDTNFGWTVEMQIKAARAQLRIKEVPVPYRCRVGQSKISGTISGSVRAGYKILYTIFKYGRERPRRS